MDFEKAENFGSSFFTLYRCRPGFDRNWFIKLLAGCRKKENK